MQAVMPARTYEETLQDHKWLTTHGLEINDKHSGEWIAVYCGKIIAHDNSLAKVIAIADEMQISPLYAQIPAEETIVYAFG